MNYRKDHSIDTIITVSLFTFNIHNVQDFVFEQKVALMPYYPRGYMGVDKLGRPIYIERSGFIQPERIWEIVDQETLWKSYY